MIVPSRACNCETFMIVPSRAYNGETVMIVPSGACSGETAVLAETRGEFGSNYDKDQSCQWRIEVDYDQVGTI